MACRQHHQLFASAVEERIGADDERAGIQLDEGGEDAFEFVLGAGLQDMELYPFRLRRHLNLAYVALGIRIVGVHEQGDQPGLGTSSESSSSRLGVRSLVRGLTPVMLPPGRARLA
jgi:hypothetical protein